MGIRGPENSNVRGSSPRDDKQSRLPAHSGGAPPGMRKRGSGESDIPIPAASATQTHQAWSRLQQAFAESQISERRNRKARLIRILFLSGIGGLFLTGLFLYLVEPLGSGPGPQPVKPPPPVLPEPVKPMLPEEGRTQGDPVPQPTVVLSEPVQFEIENGVPITRGVPDGSRRTISMGTSSSRASADGAGATRPGHPPRRGNLHVVIVDVEKLLYKAVLFETQGLDEVAGAEADGDDLQRVFMDMASLPKNPHYPYDFNENSIVRFTTSDENIKPTRDKVREWLQKLADNLKENDLFFFYFAGHGYVDAEGGQYLVMYDTKITKEGYTELALSYGEIEETRKRAKKVRAKVCIVLDCCRNMLVEGGKSLRRGSNLPQSSMWTIDDGMDDDAPRYGGIKISACAPGQQSHSWLFDGKYRGVFTYYFAQGLRGNVADKDPADGLVSVREAFNYAYLYTTRKIQNQFQVSQEPSTTMLDSQEFDFFLTYWDSPKPTPSLTPAAIPTQPMSGNQVIGGLLGLPADGVLRVGRYSRDPLALRVLAGPDSPPTPVRSIEEVRWNGGIAGQIRTSGENLEIPPELLAPGDQRLLVMAYTWKNDYVSFEQRIAIEYKPYPTLLELRPPDKPVARLPGRLEAVWGTPAGNPLPPGQSDSTVDMEPVETRWRWRKADEERFTPLRPGQMAQGRILAVAGEDLPEGTLIFEAGLYDRKADHVIRDSIKTLQLTVSANHPPKMEVRRVSGSQSVQADVRRGGSLFAEVSATDTEGKVARLEYALAAGASAGESPLAWKNAQLDKNTPTESLWRVSESIPLQVGSRGVLQFRAHDDQGVASEVLEHSFKIEELPPDIARRDATGAPTAYIEPALLLVPAREYNIGRDSVGSYQDTLPPKRVALKEFYIAATEVSQREFELFLNSRVGDGARFRGFKRPQYSFWLNKECGDLPILRVRWSEAEAYCRWLSQVSGKSYAIPTEEQWEAACRYLQQGTNRIQAENPDSRYIHWKENNLLKYYSEPSARSRSEKPSDGPQAPVPVGEPPSSSKLKPPDPLKGPLFHIFGNAREWCYSSLGVEGAPPVARGGAFDSPRPAEFQCFFRVIPGNPEEPDDWQGFRMVHVLH